MKIYKDFHRRIFLYMYENALLNEEERFQRGKRNNF